MGSVVYTNLMSVNSQRSLAKTESGLATAMQRLSSGLRINSAKDDAAGLAISERFDAQSRGMQVAQRNAADGISFSQTAEGGMQEIGDMLLRMRDLAVQSANGTNSSNDRINLDNEFQALASEIKRTISVTQYNGKKLLNTDEAVTFQVGANKGAENHITVSTSNLAELAGVKSVVGFSMDVLGADSTNSLKSIGGLDDAIDAITSQRAKLGTVMNRFEHTISNLGNSIENAEASRSRITDTDFAKETSNLARYQILQQAATSMLSQANQAPNQVLGLLR